MRFLFFTLFCTFCFQIFGQTTITGIVTDSKTGEPLPFVNIIEKGGRNGTATNVEGLFTLRISKVPATVSLSYIGYSPQEITISQTPKEPLRLQMSESGMDLNEVTVMAGENPAHRIIKNVVAARKLNDPEKLEKFYFKSYSKFWVTADVDTTKLFDTIKIPNPEDTSKFTTKIDSDAYELDSLTREQHLFFLETLTERSFIKGSRDNETVLAQRTSGFENPLFSLIVTQLQSFSFYEDYIGITGGKYLNPITPASTKRYFFILEDTLFTPQNDSLFVVSFRPRPNKGFDGLVGVLTIDARDWALANVRAYPADTSGFAVTISQEYKRYGKNSWFPEEFKARIDFNNIEVNNIEPYAYMRKKLFEVDLAPELKKSAIQRSSVYIEEDAASNAESILKDYRLDTLNAKENRTYTMMDSISKEDNWEKGLNMMIAFFSGKIPLGPVNVELNRILQANYHEALRLGLGLRTNQKVSKHFEVGGYFGYGFRDKVWKYGGDLEIFINKPTNFSLVGGYKYEIYETGGMSHLTQPTTGYFSNNIRKFFLLQYDEGFTNWIGFTYDPLPNLSTRIQWQNGSRKTIWEYQYFNPEIVSTPTSDFFYSELAASLRWAPGEDYVQGAFGKLNLEKSKTVFYLDYLKGLPDAGRSVFDYHQITFTGEVQIPSVVIGTSTLTLRAGKSWGAAPASKLFYGQSNAFREQEGNFTLGFADRNSLETMRYNEFLSDTYLDFGWRHDFRAILFAHGDFQPHLEIVNRIAIGSLSNTSHHLNMVIKTLDQPLFESGIEFNRLLTGQFTAQGIGFYYRYGPQAFSTFGENFFVKLTTKFTL